MDSATTSTYRTAGLARRLAAAVYDGFLLFAVLFAAGAIYAGIQGSIAPIETTQFNTGDITHELEPVAEGWLYNSYLLCVITLFYSGFWCKKGQTLGMQAWRIKLQNREGNIISFKAAVIRVVVALFTLGPMGMMTIPFTRHNQAIFDIVSRTYVIHLPKDNNQQDPAV